MPTIHGIATALHGKRYRELIVNGNSQCDLGERVIRHKSTEKIWFSKLTTTVLSGTKKDNIEIVSTNTDIQIPPGEQIVMGGFKISFKGFKDAVVNTLRQQTPDDLPLQIVFGYPDEMDPKIPKEELIKKYTTNKPQRLKEKMKEWSLAAVLTDIIKSWQPNARFNAIKRTFVAKAEGDTESDIFHLYEPTESEALSVTQSNESIKLLELHGRFSSGDEAGKQEIIEIVTDLAKKYAEKLKQANSDFNTTRFFLTGLNRTPYNTDPRIICISWHEDFRRAFAETLKQELGIKHNIVLKSPLDRPSPPFADVVRTYMQDLLDKLLTVA